MIGGDDTYTSLDAINGGAGTDTFNLVSGTGSLAAAAGATVTNVEIVNLTSAVAITAANVSGFTGLTTLNVASGNAISGVKAAATTDINVANAIAGVSVDGGKNITIVNSTAGDVAVGGTAAGVLTGRTAAAGNVTATNSAAAGTIGVNGKGALVATADSGAIVFSNGTSVNATASAAVSAADRAAHIATTAAADAANTNATGGLDASGLALTAATDAKDALTTLAGVAAGGLGQVLGNTSIVENNALTKTAYEDGAITAVQKVAIDAAFAAGFATSAAAARTAAVAAVTPILTTATATFNAAVTADAANDAAVAAALAAAEAVISVGGATGTDVDAATAVAAVDVDALVNTTLASATVKGNYGAANNINDGSTLKNVLTTVSLDNAGAATLTGQALTNVSIANGENSVTVMNTTAAHTETFTVSGVTAGTITAGAGATTVNVVSNGSATNVSTSFAAAGATTVNLTGAAGFNFGTAALNAAAVIDASGSSGSNKITVAATQTYTGGSGADTVTTNGGTMQAKAVDGGAGTADNLVLANNTDFSLTGAALFKNFEIAEVKDTVVADLSKFTTSAFTSVVLNGATTQAAGLNATQAANITVKTSTTATIGVTGATTVGHLDTVNMIVSDGSATVNTITLTTPVLAGIPLWQTTCRVTDVN